MQTLPLGRPTPCPVQPAPRGLTSEQDSVWWSGWPSGTELFGASVP